MLLSLCFIWSIMNIDTIISAIKQRNVVAILLVSGDDPLSRRATSAFALCSDKLSALGIDSYTVPVDSRTALTEELAAVRVPQVRLFRDGLIVLKHEGLFDPDDLAYTISQLDFA